MTEIYRVSVTKSIENTLKVDISFTIMLFSESNIRLYKKSVTCYLLAVYELH